MTEGITLEWEDPIITRWDRRRQIAVQASPDGATYPALRADVIDEIDAIELPPGYDFFWDGEYFSTTGAQRSLIPGMIPAFVIMTLIIVALFNSVKPSLVIACTVPFAFIAATVASLAVTRRLKLGYVSSLASSLRSGRIRPDDVPNLDATTRFVLSDTIIAARKLVVARDPAYETGPARDQVSPSGLRASFREGSQARAAPSAVDLGDERRPFVAPAVPAQSVAPAEKRMAKRIFGRPMQSIPQTRLDIRAATGVALAMAIISSLPSNVLETITLANWPSTRPASTLQGMICLNSWT